LKTFEFKGHEFSISLDGILFWLDKKIAIISDLHLEKGSSFASGGQLVPPYDSLETLNKLLESLEKNQVKELILLGDTFHDDQAIERMSSDVIALLKSIIDKYKVIFIRGNHDNKLRMDDMIFYEQYKLDGIHFIHEASKKNFYQITGHFHPVASLKVNSKKIITKCLIHSDNLMILPSYGHYTGGLNITKSPLKEFININSIIYLLSKKSVYKLPFKKMKNFL